MTLLFFVLFGFSFFAGAEERVEHTDGTSWTFPGKVGGDYFPSGKNSLFAKTDIVKPGGVSGGFKEDINLVSGYGLFVEQVDAGTVEKLIKLYVKRIANYPRLRQALREVLRDRYIYQTMKQFFEDGGRIEAWEFGGRYDHEKRVVSVGLTCQKDDICIPELASEATLVHELLHYIFDKTDSILFESEGAAAEDHDAMEPIDERFIFLRLMALGKAPLDLEISGLYGFTKEGKLADKIENLAKANDLTELEKFVSSDAFYTNYVHSTMLSVLGVNEYAQKNPDKIPYVYTMGQIQDVAHLEAFNAAILAQAFRLAAVVARTYGIEWKAAFHQPEFQSAFSKFLRAFVFNLQTDPFLSVQKTSKHLMDQILAPRFPLSRE